MTGEVMLVSAATLRGYEEPLIVYPQELYDRLIEVISNKFIMLGADGGRYHIGLSLTEEFYDSATCLHIEVIESMETIRGLTRQLMIEFTRAGYDVFFHICQGFAVMTVVW
jgi:hypothetical protein